MLEMRAGLGTHPCAAGSTDPDPCHLLCIHSLLPAGHSQHLVFLLAPWGGCRSKGQASRSAFCCRHTEELRLCLWRVVEVTAAALPHHLCLGQLQEEPYPALESRMELGKMIFSSLDCTSLKSKACRALCLPGLPRSTQITLAHCCARCPPLPRALPAPAWLSP